MLTNALGLAISVASFHHEKQVDKAGQPYILHPLRVMANLGDVDSELKQIAVLHDVVEDTNVTLDQLIIIGFSSRVIAGVDGVSKRNNESYEAFILRCCDNKDAIQVKMADIRDNSDITRMIGITDRDMDREQKYRRAYVVLERKLRYG